MSYSPALSLFRFGFLMALLSMLNRTEIWFHSGGELTAESVGRMLAEIFLFGVTSPAAYLAAGIGSLPSSENTKRRLDG